MSNLKFIFYTKEPEEKGELISHIGLIRDLKTKKIVGKIKGYSFWEDQLDFVLFDGYSNSMMEIYNALEENGAEEDKEYLAIEEIVINQKLRGLGLGSKFFLAYTALYRSSDMTSVLLPSVLTNDTRYKTDEEQLDSIISFYKSFGYKEMGDSGVFFLD